MLKTIKLKELLEQNYLGNFTSAMWNFPSASISVMPATGSPTSKRAGGVIIDMLAHHVDLSNGSLVRPAAFTRRVSASAHPSRFRRPCGLIVTYKNGVICNSCAMQRFGRTCELMDIYGEKGAIVMDAGDLNYIRSGREKEFRSPRPDGGCAGGGGSQCGGRLFCQMLDLFHYMKVKRKCSRPWRTAISR